MLKETCLVDVHASMGAKLVDFSGWNMPLHYGSQIEEHNAVRTGAGVFDVSHMTVIDVVGEQAKPFLQYMLANDVDKLQTVGKALYTGMLNNAGGVIDDLIVYLMADGYRLVVNCGTTDKDVAWLQKHAENFDVSLAVRDEFAMLAVQGPEAREKVGAVLQIDAIAQLANFYSALLDGFGKSGWMVARTGYTGEDGYEIILPEKEAKEFWLALVEQGVKPCGLGARDTLRLEAGMNLYGHEMDDETSPLVANMAWTIAWDPKDRDFIGREAMQKKRDVGINEKLVGLLLLDKGVLRAGQEVSISGSSQKGIITSGTFSPTLKQSIALARVPKDIGDECTVAVRNKSLRAGVLKPCFVRNGKKVF